MLNPTGIFSIGTGNISALLRKKELCGKVYIFIFMISPGWPIINYFLL
jgi:hypothetical protein